MTYEPITLPTTERGHHAYLVRDEAGRVRGVVASGSSSHGTVWTAGRISPLRERFRGFVTGATREEAAAGL